MIIIKIQNHWHIITCTGAVYIYCVNFNKIIFIFNEKRKKKKTSHFLDALYRFIFYSFFSISLLNKQYSIGLMQVVVFLFIQNLSCRFTFTFTLLLFFYSENNLNLQIFMKIPSKTSFFVFLNGFDGTGKTIDSIQFYYQYIKKTIEWPIYGIQLRINWISPLIEMD